MIFLDDPFDLCKRNCNQLPAKDSKSLFASWAYLEEPLKPPDLKDSLANQDADLEQTPPFYAGVGAFCCVTVDSLADNDVGLFVFDLAEHFAKFADCVIMLISS